MSSSIGLAQQDSTSSKFSVLELKHISKLLTETEYLRVKEVDTKEQLRQYRLAVIDYENTLQLYKEKEKNYQKIVDELTPDWFDKVKPYLIFIAGILLGLQF